MKFCKDNDIDNILTDDSDFGSYQEFIKNMKILTANNNFQKIKLFGEEDYKTSEKVNSISQSIVNKTGYRK